MKRSKAISDIEDILGYIELNPDRTTKQWAVDIINYLENSGFLPPERKTISFAELMDEEGVLRNPKNLYKIVHQWEYEDEA